MHVDCEHCLKTFEVADPLAGGIANCPACNKATPVPGLRDPLFRVVQVAMAVGWVYGGLPGAAVAGVGGAFVLGLVHLSM